MFRQPGGQTSSGDARGELALSSRGCRREWPSQSDGFVQGARSPCQRRPGWAASRLCAPGAASRLRLPLSEPGPGTNRDRSSRSRRAHGSEVLGKATRDQGGQGLAKRAGCSQAGRRAMEEQRGSGQPSPESQAPLRNRESRGRRAAGSTSQAQNSVGSRQRVPGAPARGARPPRHPEVCPSLLGPIVLPLPLVIILFSLLSAIEAPSLGPSFFEALNCLLIVSRTIFYKLYPIQR